MPNASPFGQPKSTSIGWSCSTRSRSRSSPASSSARCRRSEGRSALHPRFATAGGRRRIDRAYASALIVIQVAASFMLLIGAGLTLRTVVNLQRVDPGFKIDNLLTMRIDLNFSKYKGDQVVAFWETARRSASSGAGRHGSCRRRHVPAERPGALFRPAPNRGSRSAAERTTAASGLPARDARLLHHDRATTPVGPDIHALGSRARPDHPVVIINKTMARHYWPSEDPVGKRINGGGPTWFTIVGVVADTLQRLNEPAHDEVYRPMLQSGQLSTTWLVRTTIDPHTMERQVRDAVRAVDPEQPVDHFRTMAEVRSAWMESPKLTAMPAGPIRPARPCHYSRGHRRRRRVLGQSTDTGVRDPHGARRAARERAQHGTAGRA